MFKIIRKSDQKSIGVDRPKTDLYNEHLEGMIRFEDRHEVNWKTPDSRYPVKSYWRLPYPEEDGILPGDYTDQTPFFHVKKKNIQIKEVCCLLHDPEWMYKRYSGLPYEKNPEFVWSYSFSPAANIPGYTPQKQTTPFGTIEISTSYLSAIYYTEKKEIEVQIRRLADGRYANYAFEKIHSYLMDVEMKRRLFCLIADHWESQHPRETYTLAYKSSRMQYELFRWFNDEGEKFVIQTTPFIGYARKETFYFDHFKEAYQTFHGYIVMEKYMSILPNDNF